MSATLTLAEAVIEYDRRGAGPPLLLIPGGAGHGGVFGPLAARLASHAEVVTMSSRVVSGDTGDQRPLDHAADAAALIAAVFDEPPVVFGSSSGAITAMALARLRPELVRCAIVHEPPSVRLLADAQRHEKALAAVAATARAGDSTEAMALLVAAMADVDAEPAEAQPRRFGDWFDGYAEAEPEPPTPELRELFGRLGALQPMFLGRILVPFATWEPEPTATTPRLVPVAGIDSRDELPYRAATALAKRLGVRLTELPGGHLGPVERPHRFAAALRSLLDAVGPPSARH